MGNLKAALETAILSKIAIAALQRRNEEIRIANIQSEKTLTIRAGRSRTNRKTKR